MNTKSIAFACSLLIGGTVSASEGMKNSQQSSGDVIDQQEERAFQEMSLAINSPRYTEAEREAVTQLEYARNSAVEHRFEIQHIRHAIALTKRSAESLPSEFNYLSEYVLGWSYLNLAEVLVSDSTPMSEDGLVESYDKQWVQNYRQSQDAGAAASHLVLTTKLKPSFAPAYLRLLHHYSNTESKEDALLVADALVKTIPQCAEALRWRAYCYSDLEKHELALSDLRSAVQISPDYETFYQLASTLSQLGRKAEASEVRQDCIAAMRAQVDLSPKNSLRHRLLAFALSDVGQFSEAIAEHEKAVEFAASDDEKGWELEILGYRCQWFGEFDKAISAYAKAKALGHDPERCDRAIAECQKQKRPGQ
jgi:tetratricopeptide (TPR) repeat protein